jgi:hypothetical protein
VGAPLNSVKATRYVSVDYPITILVALNTVQAQYFGQTRSLLFRYLVLTAAVRAAWEVHQEFHLRLLLLNSEGTNGISRKLYVVALCWSVLQKSLWIRLGR